MQDKVENINKPNEFVMSSIFPNDAKLIQYTYIQQKAKTYLTHVTEIKELAKKDSSLVFDTQLIITLAGVVFNLNDNFYRRSEILQSCQKYNGLQKIDISPSENPINFDSLENISRNCAVGPFGIMKGKYVPLPEKRKIFDTIVLLELLLVNVLEIVDIKVKSLQTQSKIKMNDNYSFLELESIEKLKLCDVPDLDIRQQESILRYYLKSQMHNLKIVNSAYDEILQSTIPKVTNVYGMYNQLLRLADLYAEMRKIGKMVFFQNLRFFEPYQRSRRSLAVVLKEVNILFTQSKQNGMLLTLISRYARRTIIKDFKLDYSHFVTEFRKTASEIHTLVSKMLDSLKKLVDEYQSIEDEGKLKEFDQEYIRDKLKKDAATREQERRKINLEKTRNESMRRDSMKAQMEIKRRESMRRLSLSKMNSPVNQANQGNSNSRTNSLTRVSRPTYVSGSASSSRNNSLTNNNSHEHFLNRTDEMRSAGRDLGGIQERDESPVKELEKQISELKIEGDLSIVNPKTPLNNSQSGFSTVLTEDEKPAKPKVNVPVIVETQRSGNSSSSRHNSVSNGSSNNNSPERTIQRRNSVIMNSARNNNIQNGTIARRNSYILSPSKTETKRVADNTNVVSPTKSLNHSSPQRQTSITSPSKQSPMTSPIKQSPLSSPPQTSPKLTPNSESNITERLSLDTNSANLPPKRLMLTANQRFQQSLARAAKTGSVYGKPMIAKYNNSQAQVNYNYNSPPKKSLNGSVDYLNERSDSEQNAASLNGSTEPSDLEKTDQSTPCTEDFPGRKVRFIGVPAWTPLEDAPSQNGSMGQTQNYRMRVLAMPSSPLSVYKEGAMWKESLREEKSQNFGGSSAAKRISRMFRR